MNKLNIGVIGCGIISQIHLDAIRKNPHADLAMVVDIDESRAKNKATLYNCDYSTDINVLLNKNIDVVHVLTPHYTHFSIARKVLESSKHCLLEKPMTITTKDAKALIDIMRSKDDIKLGIVFQNRFNNTSQFIKKIIDDKTYGKLLGIKASVTWLRDKNYYSQDSWRGKWETEGGGVLINQAIHTLDLIQWFGGAVDSISGSYGTYVLYNDIEVEDTAVMFLNFKNNIRGILFATNNNTVNSPVEMELVFEKTILYLNEGKVYLKRDDEVKVLCEDKLASGEKAYWGLSHEILINNFYDSILYNQSNYIDAKSGAQTIEILEKFYRYANKIKNIKIENTREW